LSFDGLLISVPPSQPARNWEGRSRGKLCLNYGIILKTMSTKGYNNHPLWPSAP